MKAVGIHVFAGGFTQGVQNYFEVDTHLEKHNFGVETAKEVCGVNVINGDWPDVPADFAFGNPRCSAFSVMNNHIGDVKFESAVDIHEFMEYCLGRYEIFAWESVQQALTTGKKLVDELVSNCVAAGYRVAHVLINTLSFGIAQNRRRYFFVAYKPSKNFNCSAPKLPDFAPTLYDAIWHLRDKEQVGSVKLSPNEEACVSKLYNGWDLNQLASYDFDSLPPAYQDKWLLRNSDVPFGLHTIKRLNWKTPCRVVYQHSDRFIHPEHNRPLSVEEIAAIMGWSKLPIGKDQVSQLAKGVCPCVGEWLALQVRYYLSGAWGDKDYESTFDNKSNSFIGGDCNGAPVKTFNFTDYVQTKTRDFSDVRIHERRFNVDSRTGKCIRPWEDVAESRRSRPIIQRLQCQADECRPNSVDE